MINKIIKFNHLTFDEPMLNEVVNVINNIPKGESVRFKIYLNSSGGCVYVMEMLLDLIKEYNHGAIKFEIIGFGELFSSAFEFYIKAECDKRLLPTTMGMYHVGSMRYRMNDLNQFSDEYGNACMERSKMVYTPEYNDFIDQCEFTEGEKSKFLTGKDVYFQYPRMLEIQEAYDRNRKYEVVPPSPPELKGIFKI